MHIREIFKGKDKKSVANLATAFALGVALLVAAKLFFTDKGADQSADDGLLSNILQQDVKTESSSQSGRSGYTYPHEYQLEQRLEEVLSAVEGAGKVKVMLTLAYGQEILIAENSSTSDTRSKETDSEGGTREEYSVKKEETKIIIEGENGLDQPLILKEIAPKVEGVAIIAQGGDNIYVKDALIKAAQTVLGVEPHKVQVLKMKEE